MTRQLCQQCPTPHSCENFGCFRGNDMLNYCMSDLLATETLRNQIYAETLRNQIYAEAEYASWVRRGTLIVKGW